MKRVDQWLQQEAEELGLREVAGGFEPKEGVELSVAVTLGGTSAATLESVTRIVTKSDSWILQQKGGVEVTWVRPESVVMVHSKGRPQEGVRGRTGFA